MQQGTAADDRHREDWLRLHRVPGIGAIGFHRLLRAFGTPRAVLEATPAELTALGIAREIQRGMRTANPATIAGDLHWLREPGHRLITIMDDDYPARLREIADPPPLLFVRGDASCLAAPQIAIVGSRNPSRGGAEVAHEFARALSERGVVVVSGLAHGIDAHAHRGCLAVQGTTVAVTGTGPETVYPKNHRGLMTEIAARGAIVTEFPTGTPVRPENFPRRNRIISDLSLAVLVVEAAKASGSLITARHALEQGRDVYAIPGSIHNPLARGCHALIKQGAKLIETVEDVLEELPIDPLHAREIAVKPARNDPLITDTQSREYNHLLDALGHDPVPIDMLVARTGLTANVVSSMLLKLELQGLIGSQPGGLYVRLRAEER